MNSVAFKHPDDNHGGNKKGAMAQAMFEAILENGKKTSIVEWKKTGRAEDVKGVDYIVNNNGHIMKIGVTSYWVSQFPNHIRMRIGAEGGRIPHLFNSTATHWAIYSSAKDKFYIYLVSELQDFMKLALKSIDIRDCRVADAIEDNVIQRRKRKTYGSADLFYYPTLTALEVLNHSVKPVLEESNIGVVYK